MRSFSILPPSSILPLFFFNFNLLSAFLAFSTLGAGLGKRMQQLLGAHQERILITMKENTAVLILQTKL
jgi:hypothetical protein